MGIVILSYRANYERTCGRSCRCIDARADSDFEVKVVETAKEAADYLAQRLFEHEHAEFNNLIFRRWEDITWGDTMPMERKGLESIHMPGDDYDEDEVALRVRNDLDLEITQLTRERLTELKMIRDRKEAEERRVVELRETERKRQEDLKKLAELKATYEK